MRIDDILTEEQLDEISMRDVGRGIARGAGKVAGGVGSLVGGAKGVASGMRQSYTTARDAAYDSGRRNAGPASTTPTAGGQTTPPASTTQPASNPVSQSQGSTQSASNPVSPSANPTSTTSSRPTASPSTQLNAPPIAPGGLDNIKKMYSALTSTEREQLRKELDIIDDQDRLASGTNESLANLLRLARIN